MFQLTSENQSALEDAVKKAAAVNECQVLEKHGRFPRVFHLSDFDTSFPGLTVKYNDKDSLDSEMLMLQHVYALSIEDGDAAPHVPRPIHFFHHDEPGSVMRYIVMERIDSCAVSDEELQAKAAEAVLWMRSKRHPATGPFGYVCKSYVWHAIFPWRKSPSKYTSIGAVEKFFNIILSLFQPYCSNNSSKVSFEGEDVVLTQSDMNAVNFGVASDGRSIIYDFDSIRALPITFDDCTLLCTTSFAAAVSKLIFTPDERIARGNSPNVKCLCTASRLMLNAGDASRYVDENGDRVARQRPDDIKLEDIKIVIK